MKTVSLFSIVHKLIKAIQRASFKCKTLKKQVESKDRHAMVLRSESVFLTSIHNVSD